MIAILALLSAGRGNALSHQAALTGRFSSSSEASTWSSAPDMTETTRFLPPSLYPRAHISFEAYQSLEAELDYVTSDKCGHEKTMNPNICEWGFGATVNSVVKPFMHALKFGYCLGNPVGFSKYNCSGWTDLFAPLSEPAFPEAQYDLSLSPQGQDLSNCAEVFTKPITYNEEGQPEFFFEDDYKQCVQMYSYPELGDEILPRTHEEIGFFGSVSLILQYALRMSPSQLQRVEAEKKAMNWPEDGTPVLGLHFRAGDACLEEEITLGRRCDNFETYMKTVDEVASRYNISHIYLATDSDSVTQTLDKYPKYTFHYIKSIGRGGLRNEVPIDDLLHSGRVDGCQEASDTMMDLHFLAKADAFVGKFSSNIDRVAYNLMFARTRAYQPVVSLDNTWCFDFGVKSRRDGVSEDNKELYYC
eukprot:CAMPEP_0170192268 /NCGR_PEP_ID=MMETSP0040_2-20121228/53710_1 /TAXON_ID=641309 /ORGANISM="Lotharella oceanica, Strain CCMP622" /LENGTH=416 /DNA_ID=CAMNT_0010440573 /DNA_START=21 /DNA_END=1271 /DNA_ORIENTATION=-